LHKKTDWLDEASRQQEIEREKGKKAQEKEMDESQTINKHQPVVYIFS
jgi:hypothetical protein